MPRMSGSARVSPGKGFPADVDANSEAAEVRVVELLEIDRTESSWTSPLRQSPRPGAVCLLHVLSRVPAWKTAALAALVPFQCFALQCVLFPTGVE